MRIALTILAVILVSALTAALVGPYFVDWSAQRAAVAAQLSRVLGERVNVQGAVDLSGASAPENLKKPQVHPTDSGAEFLTIIGQLNFTKGIRGK